eukprot:gene25728-31067_t
MNTKNLFGFIGKFVRDEVAMQQLPDVASLQERIDNWKEIAAKVSQKSSTRFELEDSEDEECSLVRSKDQSLFPVEAGDGADETGHRGVASNSAESQNQTSSLRLRKAHKVLGDYVVQLSDNFFKLVDLIAWAYPVCWMVRLTVFESILAAYVYSRIKHSWRLIIPEIDLLFKNLPNCSASHILTQVVAQDDLAMFMSLLFTFNKVALANFPSGFQSSLSCQQLVDVFGSHLSILHPKKPKIISASLMAFISSIHTHASEDFTLQTWQEIKRALNSTVPERLHPIVYLLWNPTVATHPVVDRVVHKGFVEISVVVDILSTKRAMHKLVHRNATRNGGAVADFLNPREPQPSAAAPATTEATQQLAVSANEQPLPPKKRWRKPLLRQQDSAVTTDNALMSSYDQVAESVDKENLQANKGSRKRKITLSISNMTSKIDDNTTLVTDSAPVDKEPFVVHLQGTKEESTVGAQPDYLVTVLASDNECIVSRENHV